MTTGEGLAIMSAALYGLGGVAIASARGRTQGDNGVYLSVLVTAAMTLVLWLGWGNASGVTPGAFGFFVAAGVTSTILGRITVYRTTEMLGAVSASLFRRLIPVFSVPVAFVLLNEEPDGGTLLGGTLIVVGVVVYAGLPRGVGASVGLILGVVSSLSYALAYSLRRLGLVEVPDPALGGLIGALTGVVLLPLLALPRPQGLRALIADRSRWHWLAALALGGGQTLQFFALQSAPVSHVAVLGALDLVFAAVFAALVFHTETLRLWHFLLSAALAAVGTVILLT